MYTKEVKERKKKINVIKKIKRKVVKNKKKKKPKDKTEDRNNKEKNETLDRNNSGGLYTPETVVPMFQLSMGERTPLTILKLRKRRQIG